jgi:hypothetical protein
MSPLYTNPNSTTSCQTAQHCTELNCVLLENSTLEYNTLHCSTLCCSAVLFVANIAQCRMTTYGLLHTPYETSKWDNASHQSPCRRLSAVYVSVSTMSIHQSFFGCDISTSFSPSISTSACEACLWQATITSISDFMGVAQRHTVSVGKRTLMRGDHKQNSNNRTTLTLI